MKDQHGSSVLIETEQEQKAPQLSWATCWGMIRTRGLSPSQKSTLFNLVQNIMTNGERLFRTRLRERPDCGLCGEEPDDRKHMFTCPTFSKTSTGLQKLLNHLTGKPFKMENLAILHIELEDPNLQLPLTFFLAEVVKNLSAQRKAKKREDLVLLKANILAKVSFLEQIPNLAYASTTIDTWLKTFFATPALDPAASKGPPPPPSTNMAKGTGRVGEAHRCDGEITNSSNYNFLSCIAERATSSQPAQQHRSRKFSCQLLLQPSKTRHTAQLGHPGRDSDTEQFSS